MNHSSPKEKTLFCKSVPQKRAKFERLLPLFRAGVTNVLRFAEINNFFGDIRGMISNTFETFGYNH